MLPEVPTAAEAGLRDLAVTSWQAVMAPARMAPGLPARVHAAVVADSPESYAAFQRAETERWRGVVRAAGIKAE